MKRGRPTKDPKLTVLQGKKPSAAAKTAKQARRPDMEPGAPEMPRDMHHVAKQHWNEVVPILLELGTLTPADKTRLHMMCVSFQRWLQYEEYIDEHGPLFMGEKGLQTNPAVEMSRRMEQRYTELSKSFGLDPLSRQKLELTDNAGGTPDAKTDEPKPHQVDERDLDT